MSRISAFDRARPEPLGVSAHTMGDSATGASHGLYPAHQKLRLSALGKEFLIEMEKNDKIIAHDYKYTRLETQQRQSKHVSLTYDCARQTVPQLHAHG